MQPNHKLFHTAILSALLIGATIPVLVAQEDIVLEENSNNKSASSDNTKEDGSPLSQLKKINETQVKKL